MKSASTFLFDLIKSLTNSEKRYFTLYCQRHFSEDNHSLRLFQSIAKQNEYNETKALRETGLAKNNFAVQKNILYNQILAALIQYDTAGSLAMQMQQDIFACQKLMQKGLIQQARSKLNQIKADAEKYELHETGLQALQIEAALNAREQYRHTSETDLERWLEANKLLTEKISAEAYFKNINSRAQKLQLSTGGKSTSSTQSVQSILNEANKKMPTMNLTEKSRMDLLQTEALYQFMSGNTSKAFEINGSFIALMESQRHWIQFFPQRYFSALNNYLIDCFVLKRQAELLRGLEKMRALKDDPAFKKTTNLEPNIFRITYQIELNYLIAGGQFSLALEILPDVKAGLAKHHGKIPLHHQMNMEYLSAYVLFGAGHYHKASSQIDVLQQYSRSETAALIDDVAAIMQVICHYELGNYSILDSLVKSCKRKLNERKNTMPPDLEFDLLNGLINFSVKEPTVSDWKKLWTKLTKNTGGDKPDTPHSEYFDFFTYVYAKSQKLTYQEAWSLTQ
jgi:hypothetical protein